MFSPKKGSRHVPCLGRGMKLIRDWVEWSVAALSFVAFIGLECAAIYYVYHFLNVL